MPTDPLARVVAALERCGCDPRSTGGTGYDARCPAHNGTRRNLSVGVGDKGVVLCCHHADEQGRPSCGTADILSALGLVMADLFLEKPQGAAHANGTGRSTPKSYPSLDAAVTALAWHIKPVTTTTWTYLGADAKAVMGVVRFDCADGSKTYRPFHSTGDRWRFGDPLGKLPVYNLPEVIGAAEIVVVEGEKCADCLATVGCVVTTSSHGALSAGRTDWTPLSGKDVVILPDHDAAGEGYAAGVVRELAKLDPRPRVKVVRLPGLADGEDVADWLPRIAWPELKVGSECQWTVAGVDQFGEPRRITGLSPCGEYVFVEGSGTGLPAGQVAVVEPFNSATERVKRELRALVMSAPWVDLDVVPEDPPKPAADRWPPLRLRELPAVEPFPEDVLPEAARRLVTVGAAAIGCPADFLALPVLAIAGGVIGRSVSLRLKGGYTVPPTIFGVCVGPPSDGKSPALRAAAAPCRAVDELLEAEFTRDVKAWETEAEAARNAKPKREPPPRPRPRRIDVDDITMEALVSILADNPRGLVMVKDELTALVLGLNQYKGGKGSDRANLLSIWVGATIKKDRVTNEDRVPVRCPHPCLSIIGGLTPDMLGELIDARGRADGFLDRFLCVYPDPLPVNPWAWRGIPEDVGDDWKELVLRLWQRPMDTFDEKPVPSVMAMTPEGQAAWEDRYNRLATEMNGESFPPGLRGPWGKFRDYAARLTLILACLDHAADPTADPHQVPTVDARSVDNAWRLIAYFKSHALRVRAAITDGAGIGNANAHVVRAIVAWVRAGSRDTFILADLRRDRRWIGDADLADALRFLTDRGAIRPRPAAEPGPKGGRPPSPSFDVNPALLDPEDVTQNP